MQPALLSAAFAGLLATAAYVHPWAFAAVLVFGQAVLAGGWFRLTGVPGAQEGTGIALGAALLADAVVLGRGGEETLEPVVAVLGLVVVAALFQQVMRRDDQGRVLASMTATASGAAVTVLPAGYLATWSVAGGLDAANGAGLGFGGGAAGGATEAASAVIALVLAGAAVAGLVRLVPAPVSVQVTLALAGAGVAGAVLGAATATESVAGGVLALAGGAAALVGRMVTEYGDPSGRASRSAGIMLPLALGGPAAYLLGHFLMG